MDQIIDKLLGNGIAGAVVALLSMLLWYLLTKERPKQVEIFRADLAKERDLFLQSLRDMNLTFVAMIREEREFHRDQLRLDREQFSEAFARNSEEHERIMEGQNEILRVLGNHKGR